jgi:hypothetical protein
LLLARDPRRGRAVEDALLGNVPVREITSRGQWTLRLVLRDVAGRSQESRGSLIVQ